jgi:hypothetical protein
MLVKIAIFVASVSGDPHEAKQAGTLIKTEAGRAAIRRMIRIDLAEAAATYCAKVNVLHVKVNPRIIYRGDTVPQRIPVQENRCRTMGVSTHIASISPSV